MHKFISFGPGGRIPVTEPGVAKAGEMNFAFIDMGQGDCTIISCPNNEVLVVDCGSTGDMPGESFEEAQQLLKDWANGNNISVILTHPDQDHYNKLIALLDGDKNSKKKSERPVDADLLFFSLAGPDTRPMGRYYVSGLGASLYAIGNPDIYEVTLNATTHKARLWTKDENNYKTVDSTVDLDTEGWEILRGNSRGKDWSITIIAGNVESQSNDKGIISNTASICTLAQFGDEKFLLTGDATPETMEYLTTSHEDQIGDLSCLQVPHHGSLDSAPTHEFLDTVSPLSVVVSVSQLCDRFHLPREDVINLWTDSARMEEAPEDLAVEYWVHFHDDYDNTDALNEILKVKWKNLKYRSNGKSFWWLKHPEQADNTTGFYGFTRNFFFLYRKRWEKNVYLTGVMGTDKIGVLPGAANLHPPPPA